MLLLFQDDCHHRAHLRMSFISSSKSTECSSVWIRCNVHVEDLLQIWLQYLCWWNTSPLVMGQKGCHLSHVHASMHGFCIAHCGMLHKAVQMHSERSAVMS